MLCDICGKAEATVHLTEIIDGKVVELHICEACAQEKASQMQIPLGFQVFLGGIAPEKEQVDEGSSMVCPVCGLTYREFRKTGRLGCGRCYSVFSSLLQPLLRNIHGSAKHIGKTPKKLAQKVAVEMRLVELKRQLEKAIETEEFERAAQIRDEIKELEKNVNQQMGER